MALHHGAAYVGVIMAGGPRNLELRDAIATLAPAQGRAKRVAVVPLGSPEEVADLGRHFDVVQLHGDATPADVSALRPLFDGEIWPVVRSAGSELPAYMEELYAISDAVVIDKKVESGLGGTGERLDWNSLADSLRNQKRGRTIIAGGLNPANVGEAIRFLHPDMVDVSSGVENAPGIKNHDLLREFAVAVKRAEAANDAE